MDEVAKITYSVKDEVMMKMASLTTIRRAWPATVSSMSRKWGEQLSSKGLVEPNESEERKNGANTNFMPVY